MKHTQIHPDIQEDTGSEKHRRTCILKLTTKRHSDTNKKMYTGTQCTQQTYTHRLIKAYRDRGTKSQVM